MLTIGTPIAGKYMDGDKEVIDHTGVATAVDFAPGMRDWLVITITFYGGHAETYLTDINGTSFDTGATLAPAPCPLISDPAPLMPCH